jgi:hypothetical protein
VFIDVFEGTDRDSVREAINRWNDAGGKPKLVVVVTKPGDIIINSVGTLPDTVGGVCEGSTVNGKLYEVGISINEHHDPLSLKEVVTHELGHALGLADTDKDANAGDVMKGDGGTNGSDGNLSDHDKKELKDAIKTFQTGAPVKEAVGPPKAIDKAHKRIITFLLDQPYPPGTNVTVTPFDNALVQVFTIQLNVNILNIEVQIDPAHGSGKFYLLIDILPAPPLQPAEFIGMHFVHDNPVDPVTFQCPMNIYQSADGLVHVDWRALHTYPYNNPLDVSLWVDGDHFYEERGNGNFIISLSPGMHTFNLYVDDYQVNKTASSATYYVREFHSVPLSNKGIFLLVFLIAIMLIWRYGKIHR